MQIVRSSTVVHTEGHTLRKERGVVIKRNEIQYEHVREPVAVPRPKIEDLSALVVVHDKMELYS